MSVPSLASPATASSLDLDDLADLALLKGVDTALVAPLMRTCELRELAADETLITSGRPNEHLFLLLEGRLSVRLGSPDAAPLAFIERGETAGELSLIDHQPTSASVVAEAPSRVLVLDEDMVWMLINTSHAISSNLLNALVQRMRNGNHLLSESRSRLEKYRFHATVDALTGLFNRHWLNQMLPRQMQRASSSGEPLSLVMMDVDHFKNYNDAHGHLAGDHALEGVAAAVLHAIRPTDMAARYGGEEFLVILPGCDVEGARAVSERLRTAVAASRLSIREGETLPGVTASFGLAQAEPEMAMNDLLARCDAALYRAKADGRNCIRA